MLLWLDYFGIATSYVVRSCVEFVSIRILAKLAHSLLLKTANGYTSRPEVIHSDLIESRRVKIRQLFGPMIQALPFHCGSEGDLKAARIPDVMAFYCKK
jgi:hypothetical protein